MARGYLRGMKIDPVTAVRVWPLLAAVIALGGLPSLLSHHFAYAILIFAGALVPLGRWAWEVRKIRRLRATA
jgi:hypothetical protein